MPKRARTWLCWDLTRYVAEVLGVQPLQSGANAPDMAAASGLSR